MSAEEQVAPGSLDELQVGMEVNGTVKRIELYGAFVDIGIGQDALLHISQLGKPNVRNVTDVVNENDQIQVYVIKIEKEAGRVALSMEKPPGMPWEAIHEGMVVEGTVTRMENFGVFVEIGAERPGMIHVSELASGFVNAPADVVNVGDEVRAQIIKVNRKKKRIDMSIKALEEAEIQQMQQEDEEDHVPTAMELALRRAMEGSEDGEDLPQAGRNNSGRNKRSKEQRRRRELEDMLDNTLRDHDDG